MMSVTPKSFYHFPSLEMYGKPQFYHGHPGDNSSDNGPDEDNSNKNDNGEFFQDYLKGYVKDSPLAPVLFVIDFDNTLAVFDEMYILDSNSTNKLPSTYTRPFMYEFLDFIKSVNTNNVIIMWTAGTDLYIKQNLLLLDIAQYFDNVLSRNHCRESEKKYGGKSKSHEYLVARFPKYKRMRSILIDNLAFQNGSDTGYSEIISVKPFTLWDVAKTFGVFGVSLSNVEDLELFFTSKGVEGTIRQDEDETKLYVWMGKQKEKNKGNDWRRDNINYNNSKRQMRGIDNTHSTGDTTLLNLIIHLQNKFFSIYDRENKKIQFCGNNNYIYNDHYNCNDHYRHNNKLNNRFVSKIKNNYFSIAEIKFV